MPFPAGKKRYTKSLFAGTKTLFGPYSVTFFSIHPGVPNAEVWTSAVGINANERATGFCADRGRQVLFASKRNKKIDLNWLCAQLLHGFNM